MAIEHLRVCGACERECPGWANRCPVCGSLSLVHRITVVPTAVVAPSAARAPRPTEQIVARSSVEPATDLVEIAKSARKSAVRSRIVAARDTKLRKTAPLTGEPGTRAV